MDADFWTSRLAAVKRQYSLQHRPNSQSDRLSIDDFEAEEEVRPDFPCPYCYEEYDILSLCSHLEDEHPFESTVTESHTHNITPGSKKFIFICFVCQVCPICSVKVSQDMLNHIMLQHGHLFKLRRRLRRVAIPNSQALSLLGRDLREAHLQVLLGGGGPGGHRSSNTNTSNGISDSFLSSLILNFPRSEAEEISNAAVSDVLETSSQNDSVTKMWKPSVDPSLSREEREQKVRQAAIRATFVQDLLLSTLFSS